VGDGRQIAAAAHHGQKILLFLRSIRRTILHVDVGKRSDDFSGFLEGLFTQRLGARLYLFSREEGVGYDQCQSAKER
jgi:hypothetical protein